jgi:hypothetical protein
MDENTTVIRKIQQIDGGNLVINGKQIPISKTYHDQLFESLNFL